ncbi:MAG: RIO1 family regulatory kinase/ATPase [Caldilineaceae bacterium]
MHTDKRDPDRDEVKLESDKYASYEQSYDPEWKNNQWRRDRKAQKHQPKKSTAAVLATLVDETVGLEGGFTITYQPARFEEGFLRDSVRPFFEQTLITDILAQIKGGKEASVYRCVAHPTVDTPLLAAKVYRPRQFRNLSNDAAYREGRQVLKDDGRPVKPNDHRIQRALNKKTTYGVQVAHTSWLMYEFTTLARLYAAGAAVPKPYATSENAILMAYIGDEQRAAPTLHESRLTAEEAPRLFAEVMRNIDLMLQQGWIHGDLSAYNILYWQGAITLIDFPQVVNVANNSAAYEILARDVVRVCQYFAGQGVQSQPEQIVDLLWSRYQRTDAKDRLADFSRFTEVSEE